MGFSSPAPPAAVKKNATNTPCIYIVTGGNKGIADAIAEFGGSEHIVFIGYELNDNSYRLLTHGRMDAVIHKDICTEVFQTANLLLSHYGQELLNPDLTPFPPTIVLRDNASARYAQYTLRNMQRETAAIMAGLQKTTAVN